MKYLLLIFSLTYSLTVAAELKHSKTITIATVVPVVASMAKQLTQGTSISVELLPPEKYSIKRVPGWIERQDLQKIPHADVVVGIASVWPQTNVYPAIRSKNIAVIPIDVAHALLPGGERVAMIETNSAKPAYFWLSLANSMIMLGILQRDLIYVVKNKQIQHQDKIVNQLTTNFAQMSEQLRKIQLDLSKKLASSTVMQVYVDKPELIELGASTLLPLADGKHSELIPTLLITSRKPTHSSLQNLPVEMTVWHIDDFGRHSKIAFTQRWENMVNNLVFTD